MKEQLYTIPLMDAYQAKEGCPFCYIERNLTRHAMDFTLGSGASYMEDDIRAQTDAAGFCREHYRQMFAYGNRLGSALILETHLKKVKRELKQEMDAYAPSGRSSSLFGKLRKGKDSEQPRNTVSTYLRKRAHSCYICDQIREHYDRYLATFFELFQKNDAAFLSLLQETDTYCLPHFGDLLDASERYLKDKDQAGFRELIFPKMQESLDTLIDDVEWFEKKFDYQFRDAPWNNAKDAVQRAMQKAAGGYPADPPYVQG